MIRLLRTVWLGCIVVLFVSRADAQDSTRDIALASLLKGDKLLAVSPWLVHDGELLGVVSEKVGTLKPGDPTKAVVHALTIYRQQGNSVIKVFETEKIDGFVNITPLAQYDGDLLVGWVRDGAYHLEIYMYSEGQILQAMDASSGAMPEIVYDGDGHPLILITNEVLREGRGWVREASSTADVYRRSGKMYQKIAGVPWPKRLQDLPATTGASSK
jgi:hypothetical protein